MASLLDRAKSARTAPQKPKPGGSLASRLSGAKKKAPGVSFGDSLMMGAADPIHGGAQALTHALPESFVGDVNAGVDYLQNIPVPKGVSTFKGPPTATASDIDAQVQEREKSYQQKRGPNAGFDWGRTAGNVATTVPMAMAIPGGGITSAAASGALVGATQPVTEGDFATQKAWQTGTGAAGGAAGGAVVKGISRGLFPRPEVAQLTKEGVRPTIGQIAGQPFKALEEKASSIPLLGDIIASAHRGTIREFNKAVYNRALAPINQKFTGTAGTDGMKEVGRRLGTAYDQLLPKMTFQADEAFASNIKQLVDRAASGELAAPQFARFKTLLANKVFQRMKAGGTMEGKDMKLAHSELSRLANTFRGASDGDQRLLGSFIDDTLAAMRSTVARSNPTKAAELKAIDEGWSVFAKMRAASGMKGAHGGVFTPDQLQSSMRAADKSIGKTNFRSGDLGKMVEGATQTLGRTYPDSGTAGRIGIGAASLGGLGAVNPGVAAGVAASAAPYLPVARESLAVLLARRPELLKKPAEMIGSLTPIGGAAGGALSQ